MKKTHLLNLKDTIYVEFVKFAYNKKKQKHDKDVIINNQYKILPVRPL
jgi:hypothetical protein